MTPYQIGRTFFLEHGRRATKVEMHALCPEETTANPLAHSAWWNAFGRAQMEAAHDDDLVADELLREREEAAREAAAAAAESGSD